MITEKDLHEAIAECEGQRNPNANTCIKLAAYYIIRKELFDEDPAAAVIQRGFSRAMAPETISVEDSLKGYDSGSEFSEAIKEKSFDKCMPVLDEMMEALQVLNPRLYNGVIRKLNDV